MLERLSQRLRDLIRKKKRETELDEELGFHLQQVIARNLREGMSPEEARYAALREFGGVEQAREECRDAHSAWMLGELWQDLRYGARMLRKTPVFTAITILTLAVGIGANTAVFSILHGLLLRDLPVTRPSELVRINLEQPIAGKEANIFAIPWVMYQELRRRQNAFTDLGALLFSAVGMRDKEGSQRPHQSALLTGNAFELLGVKPYLGRLLAPEDDVSGGPTTGWPIVLSYGFWNEEFGGDPQVLGKTIEISNTVVTVVGVTRPEFEGLLPGEKIKAYLPFSILEILYRNIDLKSPVSRAFCIPIGRLKPGVAVSQANAELALFREELLKGFVPPNSFPPNFAEKATLAAGSFQTGFDSFWRRGYRRSLSLMQGLVAVTLFLCCVNVGGLMMSKAYARRAEFAIRAAMGASRSRLLRQYLTESLMIAALGAALGAAAAWSGNRLMLGFFMDPMRQNGLEITPDNSILAVSAVFAVLATLVFGVWPAWRASRSDPGSLIKSRGGPQGKARRAGRIFIPIQIALSLALVGSAGLLTRSLIQIRSESVGFDIGQVTITCPQFHLLPQQKEPLLDVYYRMLDRLEQLPGLESVTAVWYTPMTTLKAVSAFQAVTSGPNPPDDPQMALNDVGPGYFRTMGIPLLTGREFERRERDRDVCILNRSAAAQLFPRQAAIGQYVKSNDPKRFPQGMTCRVVGVAEDAKYASAGEPAPRTIYFPLNREMACGAGPYGNLVFMLRTTSPAIAMKSYRKALSEIAPSTPLLKFVTLQQQMDYSLGSQRLITTMCTLFGGLALFLSAIGLYGLLSSSVAQRTAELGVRIALGARRGTVLTMILSDALTLFAAGAVPGLLMLVFSVRLFQGFLYGVSPFDPLTIIATVGLLGAVSLLAALLPALRAASIDPMRALRAE
jgi:predicted permease